MANFFSDLLTLRDTEGTITDYSTYRGQIVTTRAFINVTSNPADNDVLMMLDIPSNAKLFALTLFNEDIGTGSSADFGIYSSLTFFDTDTLKTIYVKDAPININAFDTASGSLNVELLDFHSDKRFEAAGSSTDLTRVGDAMWQLADLDSDPHLDLRIGIALPTNWSIFTGGFISLIAKYSAK